MIKKADLLVVTTFVIINLLTYACGLYLITEPQSSLKTIRIQQTMVMYGSSQSVFGFIVGYILAQYYTEHQVQRYNELEIESDTEF